MQNKEEINKKRREISQEERDRVNKRRREYHKAKPLIRRKERIKAQYGISIEYYIELLQKQNGCCAICKKPETSVSKIGKILSLAINHNHTTNKVRELLCNNCNRALGLIKENKETLRNMILYLEKHNS